MEIRERPVKTDITPRVMSRIRHAEKLVATYGHWPDFHDSEILTVVLDRGNHMKVVPRGDWSARVAPSLTAQVMTFDWRLGDDTDRKYRLVTLRFNGIGDFYMESFSYQNPVMGIGITAEPEEGNVSVLHIDWGGTVLGHEGEFTCESIDVLDVLPFDPVSQSEG